MNNFICLDKWYIISFSILFTFYCGFASAQNNNIPTFAPDGLVSAKIKITTYGVPHIEANNLESLGFGNGYSQAKDNVCLLADEFLRVNSKRSKYFGSDYKTQGDNLNVVSDFGFKALGIRDLAEKKWLKMSENSRALILGFTEGYNYYLNEMKDLGENTKKFDPLCFGKEWVKPIQVEDVVTRMFALDMLAGSTMFLPHIFYANPGDADEWQPYPVKSTTIKKISTGSSLTGVTSSGNQLNTINKSLIKKFTPTYDIPIRFPKVKELEIGSNAWGLGKNKTENSRGMLLANPHFPHSGALRFWQWHAIIPGFLNTMGASSIGIPGIINIGFNENIAWTHTFSTAEHFIIYRLALVPGDRTKYIIDGIEKPIVRKLETIEVNTGFSLVTLEKEIYYTELGPVIESVINSPWDENQAFVIKDINLANTDSIDHWLALNLASNLNEFKQAFKDYNGVIFNNTIYSDKVGNSYYIDNSTVPNLSEAAIRLIKTTPEIIATREMFGITVLPGHLSEFIYTDEIPFQNAPQLERSDYVQNSNDSHWATNPISFLENYSPLYGDENKKLSLRTRMSLKMLTDSAGDEKLFSRYEVESALFSNRAYLPELVLDDLLLQCSNNSMIPIVLNDTVSVDISQGCNALKQWNGRQDRDSVSGHLIREFAFLLNRNNFFQIPFNPIDPANTPRRLIDDNSVLVVLASAIKNIENAGWKTDDKLGDLMFVERTLVDGSPSNFKIPWSGAHHYEGGFNVFSSYSGMDNSIYPKHEYEPAKDITTGDYLESQLSPEGYHIRFGSSWMMVVGFDEDGPEARGLLTYSQSANINSNYNIDQTLLYSKNKALRPILFEEEDILENLISSQEIKFKRTQALK